MFDRALKMSIHRWENEGGLVFAADASKQAWDEWTNSSQAAERIKPGRHWESRGSPEKAGPTRRIRASHDVTRSELKSVHAGEI